MRKLCISLLTACIAMSLYSIGYANGSASICTQKTEITYAEPTACTAEPIAIPTEPTKTTAVTEPPTKAPTEPPEFPVAQQIWDFLKSQGFSDNVSAGIMGNMMAECGGQTFNMNPAADNGSHYGVCQWSHKYYPSVNGKGLDFQLQFLMDTIHSRFKDSDYEKLINSDNPEIAALRFAIWYEGCSERSYPVREKNAQKAYDYFTGA